MAEVEGLFVAVVKGRKKKGLEAAAYANVFVSVCVCERVGNASGHFVFIRSLPM